MIDEVQIPEVCGDWVRLTERWSCQFSIRSDQLWCMWNQPKAPTEKQLMKMLAPYLRARYAFFEAVQERLGRPLIVIDSLPGGQ